MNIIELKDPYFYRNGEGGASVVVGYENSTRRVARYTFTSPEIGAQHISLVLHTSGKGSGSHIPIHFYIGTDPDSHANAGYESSYTGTLTLSTDDYVVFTGEADILLLPNTTYYLWVFPGKDSFGWYSWQRKYYTSTLETSGACGLINLGNGSDIEAYQPYVFNGTDWELLMPYLGNGSSYDLCSQ